MESAGIDLTLLQLTIILISGIDCDQKENGMYVCSCNGYRDSDLREVAREGIVSAEEAYRALGQGPCCGGCLECAQQIIDAAHLEFASGAPVRPGQGIREQTGA